jgi:hypothetical protein
LHLIACQKKQISLLAIFPTPFAPPCHLHKMMCYTSLPWTWIQGYTTQNLDKAITTARANAERLKD